MDSQTKRAIDRLTRELARTQSELERVKRGGRRPQLGNSSIDSGSLEVRDPETGATRLRLGYQPDGSVGVVPEGGDPPPAPAAPIVAGAPAGVMVQWDGRLADGVALPSDFDHVSVHVSQVQGFAPDAATFQGTIPRAGGLFPVIPLEVGTTYYVRLVGVGTGGAEGAPSSEVAGVPEAVGGVPEPGSITETELADDAVTTPKLRAEAVQAWHIVAQAIEAGHIEAGAIEAAHLAATIVLASRLVAGDPSAARVEIDENGLRGYDDGNELVFAVQGGDAVFSGTITGSAISGSRITIGEEPGNVGLIEDADGTVRTRVISSTGQRAQIAATTGQAEFTAWAQPGAAAPVGGVVAQDGLVALTMQSASDDAGQPHAQLIATDGQSTGQWVSELGGSSIRIQATPTWSHLAATTADSEVGSPQASAGLLYATRRSGTDVPAVSVQSPLSSSGPGAGRRSLIFVEGANTNRASTLVSHAARRHYFQGESVDGVIDTTTDGVLELRGTHSLLATRHAPVETVLESNPTFNVSGSYVDFTEAQMPSLEFRTGWSGRVRISLMSAGYNNTGNDTNLRLAFRLSGAQNISAAPARGTWMTNSGSGSTSRHMSTRIVTMQLNGNSQYTLHPQWYSSTNSGTVTFSVALGNTIIVEPLM